MNSNLLPCGFFALFQGRMIRLKTPNFWKKTVQSLPKEKKIFQSKTFEVLAHGIFYREVYKILNMEVALYYSINLLSQTYKSKTFKRKSLILLIELWRLSVL